ncbi:serine/threonine-protein kinase, partial [Candidatus Frankia nodulisporulans]
MEYVPADTLAATVERHGPLAAARVAEIGLAVLDALVAGQRLGVLHRDVKPSNILLAHDGRVLLTDFGIAAQAGDPTIPDRSTRAEAAGPLVLVAVERLLSRGGTPAYSAPERLVNGIATLSGDLFSLGASLYFAVEGHSPFAREDLPTTIGAVVGSEPPAFTRAGPLAHPLAGLLAKTPATRLDAQGAEALLRWARSSSSGPGAAAGSGSSIIAAPGSRAPDHELAAAGRP